MSRPKMIIIKQLPSHRPTLDQQRLICGGKGREWFAKVRGVGGLRRLVQSIQLPRRWRR